MVGTPLSAGADGRSPRLGYGSPAGCAHSRSGKGFTLVELMVTLAVAAILMVIAIPSFQNLMLTNKLTSTANDIVVALNVARMEAIKHNGNTAFCSDSTTNNTSDTLGTACGSHAGAVYVLTSGTNTTLVRADVVGIAAPLKLNGSMQALRYGGQGLAQAVGSTAPYSDTSSTSLADICTSSLKTNNHRLITMTAGSIIAVTTSTGTCP
ncbi:GspH/FimT family pseudopilin [Dyella subtropica]|uniref:GspH/FimT family pseudopilin n=1 Tax=Dyella subtropica TaxID=2992127 RepID=UPI003CE4F26C